MRNAGWKRLLAVVLVLMMTLSLMPAAFADGDVECTMGEGCPAAVHSEGCPAAPKVEVEEVVVTCTGAEGCPATVHNAGCPAAPKVEVEEVKTCTGAEGCPAAVHNEGCPAAPKVEVEEVVKTCTGAADCPATVHSEGCPAVKKTEVEEVKTCTGAEGCPATVHSEGCLAMKKTEVEEVKTCTGAADCPATVHSEGCLAVKKTEVEDEDKDEDEVKACTITEGCTLAAGHEGDCVLKEKEDGDEVKACAITEGCTLAAGHEGDCVLKEKEDGDEDEVKACTLTVGCTLAAGHEGDCVLKEKEDEDDEPSAAVQAFLDAVAAIVIPENPEEMDEDSYAALEAQIEVAYDALEALSDEELEREDVLRSKEVLAAVLDTLNGGINQFASNSTVVLHPSVNHTVTGVKVSVGSTISGYKVTAISGYDITVDLGKYNVNNSTFTLPYAKDIWEGVDNNKVQYISWAGSGSGNKSEGASALLANGKNTAYYYFKGVSTINYAINYNTQGGTSVPSTTTQSTAASVILNVTSQKPTKDGYTFEGWAETAGATTANAKSSYTLTSTNPTKTLYAVWKAVPTYFYMVEHVYRTNGVQDGYYAKTISNVASGTTVQLSSITKQTVYNSKIYTYTDGSPESATINNNNTVFTLYYDRTEKPADSVVENLLANGAVKVVCTNDEASHAEKTYGLLSGYSIGQVTGDAEHGYFCTITVNAAPYVSAYSKDVSLEHTLDDAESKTITLNFNASSKTWTVASGAAPVTFKVKCVTPPVTTGTPDAPDAGKLAEQLTNVVTVKCVNGEATHKDRIKDYGLLPDSYQIGDVTGDATSGYRCTITVSADPYVAKYNEDVAPGHKLADGQLKSGNFDLKYDDTNSTWKLASHDGPPVTFNVKCEDAEIVPPTGPVDEDVTNLLGDAAVKVDCVNADVSHADQTYALIDDSYEIGAVEGNAEDGYTCTVTIFAADYVVQYNIYTGVTHELDPAGQTSKTVTLAYDEDTSWTPEDGAVPVTFTVKCVTPPSPPVKPTENAVTDILGETAVKVDCINTGVSHGDKTYGLIDGSFTVGNVEENATGLFTCTITIQAAKYVEKYNETNGEHSLATDEATSKTITLKYDEDAATWTVPANAAPVVFRVACSTSQPATDWSKLTITKTVSPTGTVMPGDTVTYTITVTNNTGKLLSNITVSETLDRTKLESFVASADMDYDFTRGTWRIWALENGRSATLTIIAKVKADATGTINNTATITGAGDGGNGLPQGSGGSSSVSITVGTPAPMNKFTLSYNANGGKGAPSSQSVETTAKIVVMTVSSVMPTRDGYHFCGWALTPNGHVSYRPGNEITLTGDVTLYAVWATPTSSPQTGDSSNMALWAAMAGMSLAAGAVVLFVLKKRKAE